MKPILLRIAIIVFALGFTLVTFGFWGEFARAMNNYLTVAYKDDDQKSQQPPQKKGVVNMMIVQPQSGPTDPKPDWNRKSNCDKKHPCPKP